MSSWNVLVAVILGCTLAVPAHPGADEIPRPEDIPRVDLIFVVQEMGEFRVRVDADNAPNHAAQFLSRAAAGDYQGSAFHRIVPRLVIQAGALEPERASRRRVPAEESSLPATRGAVAMAWRGCEPGTAETEWFVILADLPVLQGCGTVIGRVTRGMDVVDKIAQVSTDPSGRPLQPIIIESVRFESEVDSTEASAPAAEG